MGFRFRKSINLGGGFRINLSKSGVGYSWGIPGYRKTIKANGGTRKTYSIPGTGISYVEESVKNRNNTPNNDSSSNLITGETINYENTNIKELGKDDEILQCIKKLRTINFFANIFLWTTLLAFSVPVFLLLSLIGIILKVLLSTKWKIDLTYEFDDYSSKKYICLKNALETLSSSKRMWQIKTSTKVYNTKYNAGADHNVSRYPTKIEKKLPFYIKHNIEIYSLNLKGEKMIFAPDRILFFKGLTGVYGRDFRDMYIKIDDTRFIENAIVPKDAEIVDYTWKYVNKTGGPDKRFSDNKKLPICRYGELVFKTEDGINIYLGFSNVKILPTLEQKFIEFANYHNEEIKEEKRQKIEQNNIESVSPDFDTINKEELYNDVVKFIETKEVISASLLQRKYRIGYNHATEIIDQLEKNGIIDVADEKGTRKVLLNNKNDKK